MENEKMITVKADPVYRKEGAQPAPDLYPSSWDGLKNCIMQPGVTIMEWDITCDTLIYSKNHNGGSKFLCRNASCFPDADMGVHTDDIPTLRSLLDNVMQGWLYASDEFRIYHEKEGYMWYRIHVITLRGKDRKLLKVIGQMINIDQEMHAIDKLRFRAETDALTGVYNREQTEIQIKQYLGSYPEETCALFVIDTDNFKLVNDTQGHMLGDVVLTEMAAAMKRMIQGKGIVGRIGGDEFVVFLTKAGSVDEVKERAEQLSNSFRSLFEHEKMSLKITCSIGISLYPDDGLSYKELFNNADQALYQSKMLGKDRYCLYGCQNSDGITKTAGSTIGTMIDSNLTQLTQKNNLLTDIFKFLYRTEDTDLAINMILEVVGKRFDVSRAYVFENTEDGKFCSNTYEWCNTGILPEKDHLQNVDYSTLGNYEGLYDENSIFYCRDINTLKV